MRVIEPGHIYHVDHLDGNGEGGTLTFVNREIEKGTEHEGTQTQEVLRVLIDVVDTLIDRTNHCDACLLSYHNPRVIKSLTEAQRQFNLALLYHEERALERKTEKGQIIPAKLETEADGHMTVRERFYEE